MAEPPRVAIVHDYLTQWGGAERVVLALSRAFPGAPVYTSFFDPHGTFPEFAAVDVRPLPINRFTALRHNHRLALPLLAPTFSAARIHADVAVCSSSGWAHGASVSGRKVVYCHTPAHWLHMRDEYVPASARATRALLGVIGPSLGRWDQRAAASAQRYLANSSMIRDRIRAAYGIEAEVLAPPPALAPQGPHRAVAGIAPGFVLCVSRLVEYKNVREIVAAFTARPELRLVVVGSGPLQAELAAAAPANVVVLGAVPDDQLRWLYRNAFGLVGAAYEDFGLSPLEAAAFGKPTVALRYGGYLDTVREGITGELFDAPTPRAIADGLDRLVGKAWEPADLVRHAATFGEDRFVARMRAVVNEEAVNAGCAPLPLLTSTPAG